MYQIMSNFYIISIAPTPTHTNFIEHTCMHLRLQFTRERPSLRCLLSLPRRESFLRILVSFAASRLHEHFLERRKNAIDVVSANLVVSDNADVPASFGAADDDVALLERSFHGGTIVGLGDVEIENVALNRS